MKSCFRPLYKLAGWAAAGAVLLSSAAYGQSQSDSENIQLMADALRARENGNLTQAKERLEELLRRDPNNSRVQQMLASINQDIERQMGNRPTVYGQAPASALPQERVAPPVTPEVEEAFTSATTQQRANVDYAETALEDAQQLLDAGRVSEADRRLAQAEAAVPVNAATADVMNDIRDLRSEIYLDPAYNAIENGNLDRAREILSDYREAFGETEQAAALEAAIDAADMNPAMRNPQEISPEYVATSEEIDRMLVTARARMLIGDYEGAQQMLRQVEARAPDLPEAKALQIEIIDYLDQTAYLDHRKTREEMLREVSRQWQRPQVFDLTDDDEGDTGINPIRDQLREIRVPRIEFNEAPLSRVVATLSELTVNEDNPQDSGINIVMANDANANQPVTIRLRNATMEEILNLVTQYVGASWDVRGDFVVVESQGGDGTGGPFVETEFFPISQGAVVRMTGGGGGAGGGAAPAPVSSNPFAPTPAPTAPTGGGGGGSTETEEDLKSFFQRAGIDFEIQGTSLAYDGQRLIVTQTPRNLERMRRILRNYDETDQVEIEAKFLEVQQGNLEQLGFNWNLRTDDNMEFVGNTQNRTLAGAGALASIETETFIVPTNLFGTPDDDDGDGGIIAPGVEQPAISIQNTPPQLANAIDLAEEVTDPLISSSVGILDGWELDLMIDALSRKQGSDLLSSPRVTVLSNRTAEIVVAQELIYPESYSEPEIDAGDSVGVTSGTPEDFRVRNVGIEMQVTPTVEQNRNITLELSPQVTEFEGFIEYGGQNIAISELGTAVVAPSGYLQPIFTTRRVDTTVTVFDGATVVIGGLVREEVITVNDKVPVLGDIPLVGRLFRSEGESFQKRNLLIFVTANLISPGGSPSRQDDLRGVNANALFQNPVVVTPGGTVPRQVREADPGTAN